MFLNGACYIRVSTDEQTEYSPDAQLRVLRDYARKNNITLRDEYIYIDMGISGRKADKRPAFMRMIAVAKIKPKPFDVILVHRFDRFARSREDSVVYKSLLKREAGIKVISITESIEDDKFSVILEAMLEAMAEYYSINLSDEVKKGMTEKARRGGYQSTPPLGYKMENKQLHVLEEEAKQIRFIFEQYVNHKQSPYQIAKRLNEIGVKTKRGNMMDMRGVEYILQNPVYIGMTRWTPTSKVRRDFNHPDTIVAKGSHEAIVDEKLFEGARERVEAEIKKRKPRARPIEECKHWLSGLLKCSSCGASLVIASSSTNPSFQCTGYSKGRCFVSHSITIKKLENAVLNELNAALECVESSIFEPNFSEKSKHKIEMELLRSQVHKIDAKLKRVNDAYLAGIYKIDEFKAQRKQLEDKRGKLNTEIKNLEGASLEFEEKQFGDRLSKITDILMSDTSMGEKQKVIRCIIEKIVYDKANSALEVYYYDVPL